MQRRKFLLSSLLSVPLLAFGKVTKLGAKKNQNLSPGKPFFLRSQETRLWGEKKEIKGDLVRGVLSCEDTQNSSTFLGTLLPSTLKRKGGPPLHIHKEQNEMFFVVSGEFLIQLGDEVFLAKAGDAAFIPANTPHTFANPIENNPGSLMAIHMPDNKDIGLGMEAYFRTIAAGQMPQSDGVDIFDVGPPIDIDNVSFS